MSADPVGLLRLHIAAAHGTASPELDKCIGHNVKGLEQLLTGVDFDKFRSHVQPFPAFWCPAGSATERRIPKRQESFAGSSPIPARAAY